MANSFDMDPDDLLRLADQHDNIHGEVLTWSAPPQPWLDSFIDSYGKIAKPVHDALVGYYAARQRAGEALAKQHQHTAAALRQAAAAYQSGDQQGASMIARAGGQLPASMTGMAHPPVVGETPVGHPGSPLPAGSSGGIDAGHGGTTGLPTAQSPMGIPGETTDSEASQPVSEVPGTVSGPAVATDPVVTAGLVGSPLVGPADDPASRTAYAGSALPEEGPREQFVQPTPFAAAVAAAASRDAQPAFVVAGETNRDLILARTLLASVLAAVASTIGVTWAVSVMRGPAGAGVFITSNEGRGWLPAGLFLPRQVSTPWLWDEMLERRGIAISWEGIADPARILVEFGHVWGPIANARTVALVCSGPIDPILRGSLPAIVMEGLVSPSAEVDLSVPTPDTVDRLGLTGSKVAQESLATVDDSSVRRKCLELATDAHERVARSATTSAVLVDGGLARSRILAVLEAGQAVPQFLWEQLRNSDRLLAAAMISRRLDVSRVGIGEIRGDDQAGVLCEMVFDRRCNELVFALAIESTRQSLRDAIYAHDQVVAHPTFASPPMNASVPTISHADPVVPAKGPKDATRGFGRVSAVVAPPDEGLML